MEKDEDDDTDSLVLERAHHVTTDDDSKVNRDKPVRSFSFDAVEKGEIPKGVFQKPTHHPSRTSDTGKSSFSRPTNTKPIMGHTTNSKSFSSQHNNRPGGYKPGSNTFFHKATTPVPAARPVQAPKIHREAQSSANLVKKQEITINETITVKEFSEKMGVPLQELMKKLIANKIMK